MTIYDRIRQRRNDLGMTQAELAKKMGYKSRSAINKIELGLNDINQSKVVAFAEALNTTPAYLMGWNDNVNKDISTEYSQLQPLPPIKRYPYLGKIACGKPILAEENIQEYKLLPDVSGADFIMTCQGDSMIDARIYDGDIVYIRVQPEVENGEIAAVAIDGEVTLKRVYKQGETVQLMPCNPKYPPLVCTGDNCDYFKIVGKALKFLSNVI